MKILQIRGANASGKTTIVRQFIEHNGLALTFEKVGETELPFYVSADRKIAVLGRYDKTTGGCDLFSGKAQVVSAIVYAARKLRAETIIFEGFIYGKSFAFGNGLNGLAKILGYEYIGISLHRTIESAMRLLLERNGGKSFSTENLLRSMKDVEASHQKLRAAGVKMRRVNTDAIPYEEMWKVLQGEI